MAIEVRCLVCGKSSQVPDGSAGKRARCKCGAEFRIPAKDPILAGIRAKFAGDIVAENTVTTAGQAHPSPRPGNPVAARSAGPIPGVGDPLAALGISLEVEPQREGRLLVLSPGAALPDRCVKCNVPADGRNLLVRLTWRDTRSTLIVLFLLLFLPLVWSRSYRADVRVGVCRRHMIRHRLIQALGGSLLAASVVMMAASVALGAEYGYVLLAGIVLFPSSMIFLTVAGQLLSARRIEPRLIWIRGVCPEYLAALPERHAGGTG